MKKYWWLGIFLAGLFVINSAGQGELTCHYNLSGQLSSLYRKELVITFSHDMVALGQKRDGHKIVTITPTVPGEFLWRGTKTLAFKPKSRFNYSTRYVVKIQKGIRSRQGQVLRKEKTWTFITPLAYPRDIAGSIRKYYRRMISGKSYPIELRPKENLLLRFDQPISAFQVQEYFNIREKETSRAEKFIATQESYNVVTLHFQRVLARGKGFILTIKKGFSGTEGDAGTAREFTYTFHTLKPFSYIGLKKAALFLDQSQLTLYFSNRLERFTREMIDISQIVNGKAIPYKDYRYRISGQNVYITFGKSINSGDTFKVAVNRNIKNLLGETLKGDVNVAVRVCSSQFPFFDYYQQRNLLKIKATSIHKYRAQLYKFQDRLSGRLFTQQPFTGTFSRYSPGWYIYRRYGQAGRYIDKGGTGMLTMPAFDSMYIQQQKTLSPNFEKDGILNTSLDLKDHLAWGPGFYGVLVDRITPYNVCQYPTNKSFWLYHAPYLEVFHHRNIEFLAYGLPDETLFWAYNKRTLEPLADAAVVDSSHEQRLGRTDEKGLLVWHKGLMPNGHVTVIHPKNPRDQVFVNLNSRQVYRKNRQPDPFVLTIFCERGFYKPGETVHLGGVIKEVKDGQLASVAKGNATIEVRNPEYKTIKTFTVDLDPWGGFNASYQSDAKGKRGYYDFILKYQGQKSDTYATIDYYQPNKIKLSIGDLKEYYTPKDTFRATVSGQFLSGNPMANDRVTYQMGVLPARSYPGFSSIPSLARYSFSLDSRLARGQIRKRGETNLDDQGKYTYSHPLARHKTLNFLGRLGFEPRGETREGKEFQTSKASYYFPVSQAVGIKMPYYVPLKQGVTADLVMVNPDGKLASGTCRTTLYKMVYNRRIGGSWKAVLKKVRVVGEFQIDQKKRINIPVKEPGRYLVQCETFGPDQRILATSRYISVWSYEGRTHQGTFSLDFEKSNYRVGETVRFFINSPGPGLGLLTVEKHKILDKRTIQLHPTTPVEIKLTSAHFPQVRIRVQGIFKDGVTRQSSKVIGVQSSHKQLTVKLKVPAEVKPAAETKVRITTTGTNKKGRRARVILYCVDEGNLSLSSYRVPDLHGLFYGNASSWRTPWLGVPTVVSSMGKDRWRFYHPHQDLIPGSQGVFGRVVKSDGEPFANVTIHLKKEKNGQMLTTTTSAQGYYFFKVAPREAWDFKFDIKGYKPHYYKRRQGYGVMVANVVMFTDEEYGKVDRFWLDDDEISGGVEGGVVAQALAPSARDARSTAVAHEMAPAPALMKSKKGGGRLRKRLQGIRVRQDFKEVLFFRVVETDDSGRATVNFKTSDALSTFRIMAVAYNEDQFGSGEESFLVSKKLLLEEAMPEFAREKDRFKAGVQVSNRRNRSVRLEILAKPEGISLIGNPQQRLVLARRQNQLVQFDWLADTVGEAQIKFYALAAGDEDAVLKKLPVYQNFVPETLLDFDVGNDFKKGIAPIKNAFDYRLNLTVASSIVKPARGIAQKLLQYPYGCLEQRTSRAMPFLVMDNQFIEALDLDVDLKKMRQKIQKYLDEIPKFRHADGALCYYPGGRYGSDYLTLYVLWAMKLARAKDFTVDEALMKDLEDYLRGRKLTWGNPAFYQYLLSLNKRASGKALKTLYEKRDEMSWMGKAFLLRALHHQGEDRAMIDAMIGEINNHLQIEADFAYFQHGGQYYRSIPFYSSRYATALLLQAILEVTGKYPMAPRIVRWLLEVKPWYWHTTQTNFWILYAIQEYVRSMEELGRKNVEIKVLDLEQKKVLENLGDKLTVEKRIPKIDKEFDVTARSDKQVYLTTRMSYKLSEAPAKSRGIKIIRNIYNKKGVMADTFRKGETYMVELLLETDKEVPYGVIDEPLAAGFEVLRQDIATGRKLEEFNRDNRIRGYYYPWLRQENAADRVVFYSYRLNGKVRVVYFIKAMYSGEFTWLPCLAQGMYHPQYFGRTGFRKVIIRE